MTLPIKLVRARWGSAPSRWQDEQGAHFVIGWPSCRVGGGTYELDIVVEGRSTFRITCWPTHERLSHAPTVDALDFFVDSWRTASQLG